MTFLNPDWSRWSHPQIRAIEALDFVVPLHETHLRRRHKVRGSTITSLIGAGLVERQYLAVRGSDQFGMPFLALTRDGARIKRDWVRWNERVASAVRQISG